MNIYIIRHGEAELSNKEGDSKRNLTSNGILKIKEKVKYIKIFQDSLIISSYYNRASQTADLIQEQFELKNRINVDYLTPTSFVDNAINILSKFKNENIIVVSHLPLVHLLYSNLINVYKPLNFNTGSIVHLCGQLKNKKMELIKNHD